ncbi:MAG TPA: hypothetical protein VGO11_16865 [Chthoniobacteraceae bacterium]|jgi:hypothetical protein|nr:hypothetical protein [Chthoniobacteraceae bacterium]
MSLLAITAQRFDREIEDVFCATIKRLIYEAIKAADDPVAIELVCEQWQELLGEFRALERETLLPRQPSPDELRSHKVIYQQAISVAGLLGAAVRRAHKISWNLEANVRNSLKERMELLGRQVEIMVFEYNGWHGPRLTPAQIELAKKVLCVDV